MAPPCEITWSSSIGACGKYRAVGSRRGRSPSTCSCGEAIWGREDFGAAQRAADVSATSLTHFIAHISQGLEGGRIVLMAHSLGVRVALEALRRVPVDSAVFVQGAVPVTSIYRSTAANVLSESTPVESCWGRYADVIRNAGHLLYTFTRDDDVLRTLITGPVGRA